MHLGRVAVRCPELGTYECLGEVGGGGRCQFGNLFGLQIFEKGAAAFHRIIIVLADGVVNGAKNGALFDA